MANLGNFDASQVKPAEVLEAIPAGWYIANMTASEMKPTSSGTGSYLSCEYTILEGEYRGRKLYDRINLQNPNPVAVEIGQRQLSAICHATGVIQIQDSSQFHGRPLSIKVSLRPAGKGGDGNFYEASNEVKGYQSVQAAQVQAAQQQPVPGSIVGGVPPLPPQMPANQFQPGVVPQVGQQWQPPVAQQPQQGSIGQGQQWAQPAHQSAPQMQPPQWQAPSQLQPQMQQPQVAYPQTQQQPAQQQMQQPDWANNIPQQQAPAQQQPAPAQQAQQPPAGQPDPNAQPAPVPPWANQQQPAAQPNPALQQPQAAPQQPAAQQPVLPWVQQQAQ